jgi:putative transposase
MCFLGSVTSFFAKKDRSYLYQLIQEGIERFGHRVHAFCLMTNHLHLVIQVGDTPLSKIVQKFEFPLYALHKQTKGANRPPVSGTV